MRKDNDFGHSGAGKPNADAVVDMRFYVADGMENVVRLTRWLWAEMDLDVAVSATTKRGTVHEVTGVEDEVFACNHDGNDISVHASAVEYVQVGVPLFLVGDLAEYVETGRPEMSEVKKTLGCYDSAASYLRQKAERERAEAREGLGRWYTVLLLYPDYMAESYGEETFLDHVWADSPGEALKKAQAGASKANPGTGSMDDFRPLIVVEGKLEDKTLEALGAE